MTDEEIPARLMAQGIAEPMAHAWGESGVARREGWFDTMTHAVERLTGRAPTSLTEFFAAERDALLNG